MKMYTQSQREKNILARANELNLISSYSDSEDIFNDLSCKIIAYEKAIGNWNRDQFNKGKNEIYWTDRMGLEIFEWGEIPKSYGIWILDSEANLWYLTM